MNSFENNTNESLASILGVESMVEETSNERIDENDFRNAKFYENDEIDADLLASQEARNKFEEERKNYTPLQREQYERGLAAEYTFRHAIAEHGWLAENVKVITTSEYDDYFRGIDSVVQIVMGEERYEHLGFALDFATGSEDVGKKICRTFDAIDQGFSPAVKYFESEKTGKLKNFKVPRLVVGASPQSLARLATYSSEIMSGSGIAESVKEEIANDPFRFVLFGEMEAQLSVFIHRIEKVVEQAKRERRPDIEQRATSSLAIHKKALSTIQQLASDAEIEMNDIRTQIRGDIFAHKMAEALSKLSQTPIVFKKQK